MSEPASARNILRELGRHVAEVAASPEQQQAIGRWKALNALKPVRPMVLIDQIPWHEMDVDGELTPRTEDPFCRRIETQLRRTLYLWRHMRADLVVEPFVDVPRAVTDTGFGMDVVEDRLATDSANSVISHHYYDQLATEADLEKIKTPVVRHDRAKTAATVARAAELFDGILGVRARGMGTPFFRLWDQLAQWRGPDALILDLLDRPDFTHRILRRLTDAHLAWLDQLEAEGVLDADQETIHCSGAYTDELPAPGFDPDRPRARDVWTAGMAQIFSTVSPDMHKEFELDYAAEWYRRFGLVYYGCCEPLHLKIDIIRAIPNVRKISMSPWVDQQVGAERIGRDFVFSRKPSPAFLAVDRWDPQAVEADLRATRDTCARHGCPLEFILKDISTAHYEPRRVWEWAEIAMRVAQE